MGQYRYLDPQDWDNSPSAQTRLDICNTSNQFDLRYYLTVNCRVTMCLLFDINFDMQLPESYKQWLLLFSSLLFIPP
jgi:hypothetical protein